MKARILAMTVPAGVLGALMAAGVTGHKLGFIPEPVWLFLWPSLIAVGLLGFTIGALLVGARRWLWPPVTGLVVQTFGILFLWAGLFESPWTPLWCTLIAVLFVLLVLGTIWLVSTIRARSLEQKMIDGMAGAEGMDQAKIAEIRKNMLEALGLLKKAGLGRNAIYELPWFLVIGRSQAGKTVAIKNSGLGLPVKRDRVKGVGGTHTCDWFFTNDLIFLDTPGAWVTEGAGEEGQQNWVELLRLLRKYRGRRPLDGLVVVVPTDDLLSMNDEDLEEQAANVRQVIDWLHDELRFRFPIYLLVSKCDLVEGFVEFFRGLPAQRRGEILGWSHTDPNRGGPTRLIGRGFQRVVKRLQAYRLEMMARIASVTKGRKLFFFSEEFKNLERPLQVFSNVLFESDPYHEKPVFRGFYFSSGTQGEGAPMGQAMARLAQTLGVSAGRPQEAGEEPKRSYFLLELFRHLMLGDQGLVSRTAVQWWRSRRDTRLATFLPAALMVVFLLLSIMSFGLNTRTYGNILVDVPKIVRELRNEYPPHRATARISDALDETERIRAYHRELVGFNPLRGFFMRRPGELAGQTFDVFRDRFNRHVLGPTLVAAEEFVLNPDYACTDRADVFYSIIYLRRGHRGEWSDDLRGLEMIWNLDTEQAGEAREKLIRQFTYLQEQTTSNGTLLPGVSLAKMADSIAHECAGGPESAVVHYRNFQEECRQPENDSQTTECRERLMKVLRFPKEDYDRFRNHMIGLRADLKALREEGEPEARVALEKIESVSVSRELEGCFRTFNEEIVPAVDRFMRQDELIEECNASWRRSGRDEGVAVRVVGEQELGLEDKKVALSDKLETFNTNCRDELSPPFEIETYTLASFSKDLRLTTCMERDRIVAQPAAPRVREKKAPVRRLPKVARKPTGRRFSLFDRKKAPSGTYSIEAWEAKKSQWDQRSAAAEGYNPARRDSMQQKIESETRTYGRRYAGFWTDYLEGIRLVEQKGSVPGWLENLATTDEYRKILGAVKEALAADSIGDLGSEIENLETIPAFVNRGLPEYQKMLKKIAGDLKECEKSSAFWIRFRGQVTNGDDANSLVTAIGWVEENAGADLAQGRLEGLFMEPLNVAEEYIDSPDLTLQQWGDLHELYGAVSSLFPFVPEGADEAVEIDDLVALLGRQTGILPVLHEAAMARPVAPDARDWLDRGMALSRVLFDEGSDELKQLRLKLTLGKPEIVPEKAAKEYRVEKIEVLLSKSATFDWEAPDPMTDSFKVHLFGEDVSVFSRVAASVAKRKNMVLRSLGSDFKEPKVLVASEAEGIWAPLKLLREGVQEDAVSAGGRTVPLVFTIEVPLKKKQMGTIKLPVKAEGKGLPLLLDLIQNGLKQPPKSLTGE